MREIKFRAWDKSKNEMYYNIFLDTYCYWKDNGICIENLDIMQYTGLKDKNSVYIYEGDILRCLSELNPKSYQLNKVHFLNGAFGLDVMRDKDLRFISFHWLIVANPDWHDFEVIGNIYENPELLNPRQDGYDEVSSHKD